MIKKLTQSKYLILIGFKKTVSTRKCSDIKILFNYNKGIRHLHRLLLISLNLILPGKTALQIPLESNFFFKIFLLKS